MTLLIVLFVAHFVWRLPVPWWLWIFSGWWGFCGFMGEVERTNEIKKLAQDKVN